MEAEVELHHALLTPHNNQEEDSMHTRSNTLSSLASHREAIIPIRESPLEPSPGDQQIAQLAEALHIEDYNLISQTMLVMPQVGRINPETGHMMTEDDVALYRATLPDWPDPSSTGPQVCWFLSDQTPYLE
jgi:hypothetical protein